MSRAARLGAFVLATLTILVIGVLVIGSKQYLFTPTYQLRAQFDNVAGSTDPDRVIADFEKQRPEVLILAFNSLEKAERYYCPRPEKLHGLWS